MCRKKIGAMVEKNLLIINRSCKKILIRGTGGRKSLTRDNQNFSRARGIRWCSLGINVGFEQDETSDLYRRPVLVIKRFSLHVCLVVPLTASTKKNPCHINVGVIDGREASVIVSQIRLIDTKRLHDRLAIFDRRKFEEIRKAIKGLI